MESTSTRMPAPPQRDGLSDATLDRYDLAEDATTGLLLESVPETVPANTLPHDEYEARIEAHQARIEAEAARLKPAKRKKGKTVYHGKKPPSLPGLKYEDLKIVNCARCGLTLLGESQEELRLAAISAGKRTAGNFPPPVAKRLHGNRPYCAGCAAVYDD